MLIEEHDVIAVVTQPDRPGTCNTTTLNEW